MKWLNKFLQKDEFIEKLNKCPSLYQYFFDKIVKVTNDEIWAKFIRNSEFTKKDFKQLEKEEKKIGPILKEATEKGLNEIVLLVSYLQYATADPLFNQGPKKSYWINVVLNRKSIDSFPDHNAIVHILEECGYIELNSNIVHDPQLRESHKRSNNK